MDLPENCNVENNREMSSFYSSPSVLAAVIEMRLWYTDDIAHKERTEKQLVYRSHMVLHWF